ncbi:MAG: M20/M25/M40 family metallo-hydrolase, partial [Planctomycetes bacterium]|nr:M20/M25/M40 family metallo-hydrolase [Planctomycetota bacterium]
ASDPLWRAAASPRARLSARRRRSSAPQFLVRRGLIPDGEIKATIKVPEALDIEVDLSNVVGLLRGTKRPDEFVVFSAHYDHIGVGLPVRGDSINNGADDDATGTTAVMELARYFAASGALDRSLLFVAFSAEEQGLRGSRAFAENPPVPLEQIVANVNIEMIGRPEEGKAYKAWVTGTGRSDFVDYARRAFERAGLGIVEFKMGDQLFRQSDNWSLAQKGVVAHSLSAGSLHQDYHKPSDEVSRIEIEHMTAIIRGLAELGRELAAAQGRPQWTK